MLERVPRTVLPPSLMVGLTEAPGQSGSVVARWQAEVKQETEIVKGTTAIASHSWLTWRPEQGS